MKNPLKLLFIYTSVCSVLHVVLFSVLINAKDSTWVEEIASHQAITFGLGLSIVFIIFYLLKKLIAWWIAMLYIPIMFVVSHIIVREMPSFISIISTTVMVLLLKVYLKPKYNPYKEYIGQSVSE
jgi:hypothetical protein